MGGFGSGRVVCGWVGWVVGWRLLRVPGSATPMVVAGVSFDIGNCVPRVLDDRVNPPNRVGDPLRLRDHTRCTTENVQEVGVANGLAAAGRAKVVEEVVVANHAQGQPGQDKSGLLPCDGAATPGVWDSGGRLLEAEFAVSGDVSPAKNLGGGWGDVKVRILGYVTAKLGGHNFARHEGMVLVKSGWLIGSQSTCPRGARRG